MTFKIDFSTVKGYFLQDDIATDPKTFMFTEANLGLKNRAYFSDPKIDPEHKLTQWQRFEAELDRLNHQSVSTIKHKLLYLGRHGQGIHNVAEARYGTAEWDRYWSTLDGDGTVIWADAHLTDVGIEQAKTVNHFWFLEISRQKIAIPETYYTSPLHRCLATAKYTFAGLEIRPDRPFRPVVKELLREVIGVHTCDRRSNKTYLHQQFPEFTFEPGFAEADELWKPDYREDHADHDRRTKSLLDDIFTHDESTIISLTSHSGAIASILRVVGHREFRLTTGSVIPVLVRATFHPNQLS